MPIYRPTELQAFLNRLGIFPKKKLSQNFLIDGNIIRKIVQVSHVTAQDLILEIGPGPGSLTQAILETNAHLFAVEKDPILAKELERLQTSPPKLSIFCDDIMNFSLEKNIAPHLKNNGKAKVIANLPYHLTTPIIANLITRCDLFSTITVMVQEEVAKRFTAIPGTSEYSSFTLFLEFYSKPHYAFTVSRKCFYPIPKVNSAIVFFELHPPLLEGEKLNKFFQLTRTAFEHRRKMLRSSLKDFFPPSAIEESLIAIGENPLARPEMLSLQQFLALQHTLEKG